MNLRGLLLPKQALYQAELHPDDDDILSSQLSAGLCPDGMTIGADQFAFGDFGQNPFLE